MHYKTLYMGLYIHYANMSMQYAGGGGGGRVKTIKMIILDFLFISLFCQIIDSG